MRKIGNAKNINVNWKNNIFSKHRIHFVTLLPWGHYVSQHRIKVLPPESAVVLSSEIRLSCGYII
mgnify:CR=1 FL=1